ncbi:pyocin knob domain-containing protein [Pseudomonas helleri]|uniref:pyocin knob domain-containing protein n=1 Tax=Pseudomonas helleri TaxID=1608996 RepID=UPI00242D3331|nr:pyocin knob domain-containing protein [Pseudomonas helleri]
MAEFIRVDMNDVWAAGGDSVPPTKAKIAEGWLVEAVPRQWWNWMQNRVDSNVAYLLQKGLPEWDSDTEYFANKSIQQYRGVVYKALKDSKGVDPTSAGQTSWAVAFVDSTPYLEKIKNIAVTPGTIPLIDAGGNAGAWNYGQTGLSVLSAPTPTDARNIIGAQVAHPNLTALSSVTGATNVLPYFNGSSTMTGTPITTFSRDFLSRSDPTSGRAALGLGTASIYNAQPVAWSTGTLMFSGAFGLGGFSIISSTASVNVNDPNCPTGFYDVSPDSIPGFVTPIPGTWTRIIHQNHANSAGFATQIATGNFATPGIARIFVRKAAGTGWSDWTELMNSTTFPTQTSQTNDAGNTSAAAGGGKLLRTGAFGIGARLDLRDTVWSTGVPSQMQGHGTVKGMASGGQLGVPGLGVGDLGVLTVDAHWTDNSGIRGYVRTFTNGDFMYIQPSGGTIDSNWAPWRQIYTSANTTQLTNTVTASVTANIQPTLNAKLDSARYGVTQGDQFQDPNLTVNSVILSNHPNGPDPATYWHITTTFYASISSSANRGQVAVEYNPTGQTRSFIRSSYDGVWKPWVRIDNNGVALSATRLANPRTLGVYGGASGSVVFDGTADVSIPITIVNDSHLHSISTISGLQAALDVRTPNSQLTYFTAAQSALESPNPSGQVVFSVTNQQATGGYSPGCSFVRPGYFGVNLGLSNIDNHLRIGGYSMGAVSYPILHTGNAAALGFGGTSGALGASGWTRLGNGLIIQWGAFSGNGNIPFPTAFPNACVSIAQMQSGELSGNVTRIALNGNPAAGSFNVTGVNPSFNLPARWIALGY